MLGALCRRGRADRRRRPASGNPSLDNETAWGSSTSATSAGAPAAWSGSTSFYRDIKDLIELVATSEVSSLGPRPRVRAAQHRASGKTWGVELDFSAPLDVVGLPYTGLFFNPHLDGQRGEGPPSPARTGRSTPTSRAMSTTSASCTPCRPGTPACTAASMTATWASRPGSMRTSRSTTTRTLEAFIEKRFGDRWRVGARRR